MFILQSRELRHRRKDFVGEVAQRRGIHWSPTTLNHFREERASALSAASLHPSCYCTVRGMVHVYEWKLHSWTHDHDFYEFSSFRDA